MAARQPRTFQNQTNLIYCCALFLLASACSSFSGPSTNTQDPPRTDTTTAGTTDGCQPSSEEDRRRPTVSGTIVRVGDGDTATLQDGNSTQHKIRMFAIDAPENAQEFGEEAKSNLSSLILRKPACVMVIEKDRYDREVGVIYVGGEDINLAQLKAGMAWHYKAHQRKQSETDRSLYDQAENQARAGKQGLWRQPVAVAPWDYRKINPPRR